VILVIGRLSPVEGRRGVELSLFLVRHLSGVKGQHEMATSVCFLAISLVAGRFSAVESL